jgi:hypothetical protein
MRILFKLRELKGIQPWGTPPHLSLSWFGLTDGAYCIEAPAGRLLDFGGDPVPGLGVTWCDYQVARLFEDLIDLLPTALEPVPADIVERFLAWQESDRAADVPEDDQLAEIWYRAQEWWGWRQLDFGYLTACPRLHLWRSGSHVHGRWRTNADNPATASLTVKSADFAMPAEQFSDAATGFFRAFLGEMRERVASIARDGWPGKPCDISVAALQREQREREGEPENRSALKRSTDWDSVRRDLQSLGA